MTMSGITPRRRSSGSTSAAFPTRPTDSGAREATACRDSPRASSRSSDTRPQYPDWIRRSIFARSTSTTSATPPFSVTASGWAPPIPPHPLVSTRRPARVPPKLSWAAARKVMYVPCAIPCVPMYCQPPAVNPAGMVSPRRSSS